MNYFHLKIIIILKIKLFKLVFILNPFTFFLNFFYKEKR